MLNFHSGVSSGSYDCICIYDGLCFIFLVVSIMKGIIINPYNETIKPVEYTGDWRDIALLIECDTFTVSRVDEVNDLYLDDEGLLIQPNRYFMWKKQVFAGNGLLLGHNEEGDSIETTLTLKDVEDAVEWLPVGHKEFPFWDFKVMN